MADQIVGVVDQNTSTVKNVRTIETVIVGSDGSQKSAETEVVAGAGPDGMLVDIDTTKLLVVLCEIRNLTAEVRDLLSEMANLDLKQALARKGRRTSDSIRR